MECYVLRQQVIASCKLLHDELDRCNLLHFKTCGTLFESEFLYGSQFYILHVGLWFLLLGKNIWAKLCRLE